MGAGRWIALAGLAAVALAATAAGLAFRKDMAAARAATEGRSRVIDSPYGAIEYADVGSGPVVLVIHGSGGGFDQGLAFAAPLLAEPVRVIAPSRFGYLRSAMPGDATPQTQADALAYLLKTLEVDEAVIFGGSAGALSAMQLALRHPGLCRGLVLGVPASYAPERAAGENAAPGPAVQALIDRALGSDLLFWAGIRLAPGFMTRMILATDPALVEHASQAERRRVAEVLFHILPISARRRGLMMDSATAGAPPPYPIEEIACPMLVISAEDDLYGTAKSAAYTAAKAKDARLVLYPTGGHLWVGHDAEVWALVADFVRPRATSACPHGRDDEGRAC